MLKKIDSLYIQLIEFCEKKRSKWFLYFISLIESIFFPFPTDPFLILFVLAEKKYLKLAFLTTFFSVVGGIIAYYIGNLLWEYVNPILELYYPKMNNLITMFERDFLEYGIILIVIGGVSPFPYKITCIAAGILGIDILIFIFCSFFSRGIRFYLVSLITYKYGEQSIGLIRKNIFLVTAILTLIFLFFILRKF